MIVLHHKVNPLAEFILTVIDFEYETNEDVVRHQLSHSQFSLVGVGFFGSDD